MGVLANNSPLTPPLGKSPDFSEAGPWNPRPWSMYDLVLQQDLQNKAQGLPNVSTILLPHTTPQAEYSSDPQIVQAQQVQQQSLVNEPGLGPMGFAPAIFAGPKAATADLEALASARSDARLGISPVTTWKETGWYQDAAGHWWYEIPDYTMTTKRGAAPGSPGATFQQEYNDAAVAAHIHDIAAKNGVPIETVIPQYIHIMGFPASQRAVMLAKMSTQKELEAFIKSSDAVDPRFAGANPQTVANVVSHPELKQAYPDLFKRPIVEFSPLEQDMGYTTKGAYSPSVDAFILNKMLPADLTRENMIHELQHGVQKREGAQPAPSAQSQQDSWEKYFNDIYEVQARNAAHRRDMTPMQRKEIPAWSTEDVDRSKQIIPAAKKKFFGLFGSRAPPMTPEQFQALIDYMRGIQGGR